MLGSRVVLVAHCPLLMMAMEVDREEEVLLLPDFSVAGVRAVLSLLHGVLPQQVRSGMSLLAGVTLLEQVRASEELACLASVLGLEKDVAKVPHPWLAHFDLFNSSC